MENPTIHGEVASRFEPVRKAFAESFARGEEVGAAVALSVDGELVVDLWAGWADQAKTRPWESDTLVNVYSTTKGMAALCAHQLIDEGLLDLDAPVAEYWPEFAARGKERMPVRHLLSHRAGLPAVRELLPMEALYDWKAMTDALAAEEPWWTPGESHGYHAVTFGWLVGEVVRRVRGKSLGTTFREYVAKPLDADFHIGLPAAEHGRVAELSALAAPDPDSGGFNLAQIVMSDPMSMAARAFLNPPSIALGVNYAAWREAEIPGANGHANARALARIYGAVADRKKRGRVLSPEGIERARTEHSVGPDGVLMLSTRFGLGFMLPQDTPGGAFGPSKGAFGHPGAGGSVGFADPESGVGFGYTMNRAGPHILLDPRATSLIDVVYGCLR